MGKDQKYTFLQRRHTNGQESHENMFNVISQREMQIKTATRYHFTSTRMAIIKKTDANKCWQVWRKIGSLLHCCWECKTVQPLWKTVWEFLNKVTIELPYYPAIPLPRMYFCYVRELTTFVQTKICPQMLMVSLFKIAPKSKQPSITVHQQRNR